jgi:NAD(P)-dependent dehydrogenase (short-subunit alcohol dehydrogenase family)
MTFPYRQAVAVVTGASSGLGRRLALDLAASGATVVAVARRAGPLEELARTRPGIVASPLDVTDLTAWSALLEEVEREHGRVDVLVNAAGIEHRRGVDEVLWSDVDEALTVNFRAAARGTLSVLPGMRRRDHGVVCNVSSDHGRAPGPGTPAYCASKAALSAFSESLAHELHGTGVHVHVLYPGWVPTPLGRGAVDAGMPMPPKVVRRSEEEVSALALERFGSPNFEINAARMATLAPVARALAPPLYRRSMRSAG